IQSPEIIGARYQSRLLPDAGRRDDLITRLRANMQRNPESALARQSALLLAYLGFQTDDRMAIAEGLDLLESAGDPELAGVLRRIWQPRRADRGEQPEQPEQPEGDDQP